MVIASRLVRGQLYAGEWLLVALAIISLGIVAILVRPAPAPRTPADQVRIIVAGASWRIPTEAAPQFSNPDDAQKIPSKYNGRTARLDYFQDPRGPAIRQETFYLGRRGLEYFSGGDAKRYGGLDRLDQLWVGGAPHWSAFPDQEREAWGPSLFARPTIVFCQDVPDLTTGKINALCRLYGWAPGGVPVELLFTGGDVASAIGSVEALLTDLRQDGEARNGS